jgi:crotonobetainyl-CoA:carnitine CoA-transferase CaiB-like acyl-CoA transferase
MTPAIDVALLDSQVAWLGDVASNHLILGQRPRRYGNSHANIVTYKLYGTQDGYIAIGVGNDRQWQRGCEMLGKPEWAIDARSATDVERVGNRSTLISEINCSGPGNPRRFPDTIPRTSETVPRPVCTEGTAVGS